MPRVRLTESLAEEMLTLLPAPDLSEKEMVPLGFTSTPMRSAADTDSPLDRVIFSLPSFSLMRSATF